MTASKSKLPEARYTICRIGETGRYTLEDEYSVIMEGAHLDEVFREIEDREGDEGYVLESEMKELELGKDE